MLLHPQLIAFLEVVKQGTVHEAAEKLFLTQTAVTQRIKQLEEKLQISLFIRSRKGMALTAEGEVLRQYCQNALKLTEETLATLHHQLYGQFITLTLSAPTSVMHTRVLPACQKTRALFPALQFHFHVNDGATSVAFTEADLAIVEPEQIPPNVSSVLLRPEDYVLVCTTQWKGRKLSEILSTESIIDFNPSDMMTIQYLKKFSLLATTPLKRHFANHTELMADLIQAGMGYGVLTREFSAPFIKAGNMMLLNSGKTYPHHLALIWHSRPQLPEYLLQLIQLLSK